jgi:ABC-2 type transport system ATP-binding protein
LLQLLLLHYTSSSSDIVKTIILTSHYLEEIEEMCERVVIIKDGNIVYDENIMEAMKDGKLEKKYLEITQN